MDQHEIEETPPGLTIRIVVSIIVFFGLLIFAIIYVAFLASTYTFAQQVAVIIVAVLAATAILGVMWVMWGMNVAGEWERKRCE